MRTILALGLILLSLSTFAPSSHAAVWENTASWNASWELKYQKWVADNWNKNYFAQDPIYKGILVDCADAVYSMRYIFAAANGLPFVIKDGTGGLTLITNQMSRWDGQTPSQRKRSFLLYLYDVVSTQTLAWDTYPVALSRKTITSGAVLRTDAASHHSWTLKYVSDTGIPYLIFSSRPAKNIMFTRYEYPSTGFTFPNGLKPETNAGFRAFIQPQHAKLKIWEVPGYTLEQFNLPIKTWAKSLQKILQVKNENVDQIVTRQLISICDGAQDRVIYVNDALAYLKQTGLRCLDATEYDDLSSPSRDQRLLGSINDLKATYLEIIKTGLASKMSAQILGHLQQVLDGTSGTYCQVKISTNSVISLYSIVEAFEKGWVSSNPHDSLAARWGQTKSHSALANSCPVY